MSESIIESTRQRLCKFTGRYQEVADLAGVSYSWVSKFANGERGKQPSFDLINKLQRALDVLESPGPHAVAEGGGDWAEPA